MTWVQGPRYFCSASGRDGCSVDMRFRSVCNLKRSSSATLSSQFQYFSDPYLGGESPYTDYCPYFSRYSDGDCKCVAVPCAALCRFFACCAPLLCVVNHPSLLSLSAFVFPRSRALLVFQNALV